MAVRVRDAATWKTIPDADSTKPLYVRDGGAWKVAATLWYRDGGVWRHDPNYLIPTSAPTNFRVTSTSTDYSGVDLAWDWSGGPTPHSFVVKVYDYGGNPASVPDTFEMTVAATARTHRVSLSQGTYAKFDLWAVSAPDNVPVLAAAHPQWHVGVGAYTVYDIPIYGWANTWEWTPPLVYVTSSLATANAGDKAVDNNTDTAWISASHGSTGTVNDWEGIVVRLPYWAHHRYVGVRLIQNPGVTTPCYVSHGILWNNVWQGSINQPMAVPPVNAFLNHPYFGYWNFSADQYLYEGYFVTDEGANPSASCVALTLGPNLVTGAFLFGYFAIIKEVRLLLQNWVVIDYLGRDVAAVPSAAW